MTKDIPGIIKSSRIQHGYTQKDLADKLGFTNATADSIIRQWESGKRPVPLDKIRPLAAALNLTLDDLIP